MGKFIHEFSNLGAEEDGFLCVETANNTYKKVLISGIAAPAPAFDIELLVEGPAVQGDDPTITLVSGDMEVFIEKAAAAPVSARMVFKTSTAVYHSSSRIIAVMQMGGTVYCVFEFPIANDNVLSINYNAGTGEFSVAG